MSNRPSVVGGDKLRYNAAKELAPDNVTLGDLIKGLRTGKFRRSETSRLLKFGFTKVIANENWFLNNTDFDPQHRYVLALCEFKVPFRKVFKGQVEVIFTSYHSNRLELFLRKHEKSS